MKKTLFCFVILLLFCLFWGCVQETKFSAFEQYEKYFDENRSSFVKVNISSFHEVIASLDKDSNIELVQLSQEYFDFQKDKNFIVGAAYCGNKELTFGRFALKVTDKTQNSVDLNSIEEIKKYFLPISDSKEATTFILLGLDNVDYNSIYALNVGGEYLVKLIIKPSACDCGDVQTSELWFVIGQEGEIQLAKTKMLSKSYASSCIS